MRTSCPLAAGLCLTIFLATLASASHPSSPDAAPWISQELRDAGLDTPEKVELLSSVRLQAYMLAGLYRPAADSPLWSLVRESVPVSVGLESQVSPSSRGPPFDKNVRVSDVLTEKQNEISLDSDVNGNLYSGWNDNRLFDGSGGRVADYRCGFSGSKDGGKTWSANDLYQGPNPEGGDAVVVGHGNVLWRMCMSFIRDASSAQIMISKSTDGGTTWGAWIKASQDTKVNDKPWFDFDGDRIYIAVYVGSIEFWKSDDGGTSWKAKQNLGSGQGNCILAGNNGIVMVGWGSSSRMMRSTDYGVSFTTVKSGFVSGGGGSNPRSSPLIMCAKDSARQHMYYTWASSGAGAENVYMMHSADEGATWGTPVRVAPGSDRQVMPGVDVSSDGVVHVGWSEWKGNPAKVYSYYSNSTDKGVTWLPKVEITDAQSDVYTGFMGDYQQLDAATTNRIGYIWSDARENAAGDTYFGAYDYKKGGGGGGNATIAKIEVTPPIATITADQTQQLTAKALDANNNQVNTTFSWTSSGGAVSQSGLFTPSATGSFTVSAAASGKIGNAQITVNHGTLVSVVVSPQNPTVAADQTLPFILDGKDVKGNVWRIGNATWVVSGGAGVGVISSAGLYTPDKVGTYTVEGADPASSMKASTQVQVVAGAPKTVTVDPPTAIITADDTQAFTATVADAKGNPTPGSITWNWQDGSMTPAGLFSPNRVGTWEIGATSVNAFGKASVTVTLGALARLAVTPDGETMTADETKQFVAKGYDAKDNEITLMPALIWSADNGSLDAAGLYTPDKVGAVTVTAKAAGASGSAKVTVTVGKVASLAIAPKEVAIDKGELVSFTLSGADAKGNAVTVRQTDADWSVVGAAIGTVKDGTFTSTESGETVVRATVGGASAEAKVTVRGSGFIDSKGGVPLFLIILVILAVAALAAVGAIVSRKRKKKREAARVQQTYQMLQNSGPGGPAGPGGPGADGQWQSNQWQQPGYDQTPPPQGQGGWPPQGPQ